MFKTTNKTTLLTGAALVTALSVPSAFAVSSMAPTPLPNHLVRAVMGDTITKQNANQNANQKKMSASAMTCNKLIGMDVQNKQGQSLGEIDDVVLNVGTGDVQYVVLSDNGGLLGVGESLYAVPWSAFSTKTGEDDQTLLLLDTTPEKLEQTKALSDSQPWPRSADEDWDRNKQDADRPERQRDRDVDRDRNQDRPEGEDQRDDVDPPDVRNRNIRPGAEEGDADERDNDADLAAADVEDPANRANTVEGDSDDRGVETPDVRNSNIRPDHNANEIGDNSNARIDNQFERADDAADNDANNSKSEQLQRVTDLIGTDVQTFDGESLGEIEDIVIDGEESKATYAKIGYGGSLIRDQKMVYVPFEQLYYSAREDVVKTSMSQEQFMTAQKEQGDKADIESQSFHEEVAAFFADIETTDVDRESTRNSHLHGLSEEDMAEREQKASDAWNADSAYNKMYKADTERTISGTVTSVGSYRPVQGAESGVRYRVVDEQGQSFVVHAGPRSFLNEQGAQLRYGDEVEVTGSVVESNGREIIMAREISEGDMVLQVRNEDGAPQWDTE